MPGAPVHRLGDQRRAERLPDGAGEVVPENQAGRCQRQAAGEGQQQGVEHLLFAHPRQGLQQRGGNQRRPLTQQRAPVALVTVAGNQGDRDKREQASGHQ